MLKALSICLSFLCCGSLNAQISDVDPVKILFIGNSYTHYNDMPEMFEKLAVSQGQSVEVSMSAESNHTFKMHSERKDLFTDIAKKKWDYVVLQGFSRELSFSEEHIEKESIPYFEKILKAIEDNSKDTRVLLYMTWGYQEGASFRKEIDSYEKMSNEVRKGYKYVASKYDLAIVPVGDVWRKAREHKKINLYQEDGQHPTLFGSYLIANTFYSAIFRMPVERKGYRPLMMRRKHAKYLQRASFEVVSTVEKEYRLLENIVDINIVSKRRNNYAIQGVANYSEGVKFYWDFGDGTTLEGKEVSHRYSEKNVYELVLTIVNDKGDKRTVKKKIDFR